MGLDMYLYRREYISGWDWNDNPKEEKMYKDILEYTGAKRCVGSPHAQIEVCVAYWRKANAIHGWFVNQLGGGVDECQSIYASKEDLEKLRMACNNVLKMPVGMGIGPEHVAADYGLLPTRGFFFGSYEIDEYYMEDLRFTITQIDAVLGTSGEYSDFIYRASW
jgi:hypothetical protein